LQRVIPYQGYLARTFAIAQHKKSNEKGACSETEPSHLFTLGRFLCCSIPSVAPIMS